MQKFTLALLVLLAFSSIAMAEWTEGLRVLVTDMNGYPAANVPVKIEYQKNTFLSLETVDVPPLETKYDCPAGLGGIDSISIDPVTGEAQVNYTMTSGGCGSLGQAYIDVANLTPSNLTLAELGEGEVVLASDDTALGDNTKLSSVDVKITRFNLDNVDGKIEGKTDQHGVFEASVQDQVPEANATKEYLVTAGGEKRRVRYGDNFINGRHVESFAVKQSFTLVPVRVVDAYGAPLEGAFVSMACSDTKNTTTNANGYAYIYSKASCAVAAQYGIYKASQTPKFVAEPIIVLNVSLTTRGVRVRVTDDKGKSFNGTAVEVMLNNVKLNLSANGTGYAQEGISYGDTAVANVRKGNYSLTRGILLLGSSRFSLPTNQLATIKIPNYNNTLTVTVVDENGAPFANALVDIGGRSLQTAPDGSARFDEIHNGTASVKAFVLGVEKSRNVSLDNRETSVIMEFRRNPLYVQTVAINNTFDKGCKVNLVAVVNDPRMKRQGDISLSLAYAFAGGKAQSKQMLVSVNGSTSPVSIACPSPLPSAMEYQYVAVDQYGNYTSPKLAYTVKEGTGNSPGAIVSNTVDELTKVTGSETNALVVVTVIMVAFIVILSIAALTALANRGKAKEMGPKKEGDRPAQR